MRLLFKRIPEMLLRFKKQSSGCDGCAYFKAPKECHLFTITEDWVSVKAKNGCDEYLAKDELIKR